MKAMNLLGAGVAATAAVTKDDIIFIISIIIVILQMAMAYLGNKKDGEKEKVSD